MPDVIDLASRRPIEGTAWWSGTVGCTSCGHQHVAVAPIPDWADGPGSLECPSCKTLTCLPVALEAEPVPWQMPE